MGTYGYAPCDGDAPCCMAGEIDNLVAKHLIKLFKKPLPVGSTRIVRSSVLEARLKEARKGKRPGGRSKVTSYSIRSLSRKRKEVLKDILKEGDPSSFHRVQHASGSLWNRLGVVQILSEKGFGIPVSVVSKCRAYLRKLAKDDGFADSWRQPGLFKDSVQAMLSNVELVLARDKVQQHAVKQRQAKSKRRRPRKRGPRLIYDAFFRDRAGVRRIQGTFKLLPLPVHAKRKNG